MSQAIRRTCPNCLSMNVLAPSMVRVDEWPERGERSTYTFTCQFCARTIEFPAPFDVLALLACASGVQWHKHGDATPAAAPLDLDDLHDFMMALESTPDQLILQLAGG